MEATGNGSDSLTVVVVDVADLDVMETDSASFDGLSGHSLGA